MNIFDYEYYDLEPNELWVYNKLQLSKMLNYNCGPVGVKVKTDGWYIVRPAINFQGLGMGAQKVWLSPEMGTDHLPVGHFWCEWFEGTHHSVDYYFGRWLRTTVGKQHADDLTKWHEWVKINAEYPLPRIIRSLAYHQYINCEFIGDRLIEVHLRKNPDFSYNNNVFIPVWEGDVIDPPDGYRYVECPDVNGRIGAYVDIT